MNMNSYIYPQYPQGYKSSKTKTTTTTYEYDKDGKLVKTIVTVVETETSPYWTTQPNVWYSSGVQGNIQPC